jgi:hypothetical protein
MAERGQKIHRGWAMLSRRDEECSGVVRRAYVREQSTGRQRWVVIGEYCNGCKAFWPLEDKRVSPVGVTSWGAEPESPPNGGVGAAPAFDVGVEEYDEALKRLMGW